METQLFPMDSPQVDFDFPETLTEKYKPHAFADFVGLEKIRKQMSALAAKPFASNWYFVGPSGTGKTSMAFAVANAIPAEVHHIPSKECTADTVRELVRQCHYAPRMADTWKPCKMHAIIADEADQMSYAAQQAFLSVLDFTNRPPNTIILFTGNALETLEDRFLSRCQKLEFSSYGISAQVSALLEKIWTLETDNPVDRPNFARLVKESNNNVREALMRLQSEIMAVAP